MPIRNLDKLTNRSELYRLHAHLYARPPKLEAAGPRVIDGLLLPTWNCSALAEQQFAFSFEEMAERLSGLERLHLELDGSFVWGGEMLAANDSVVHRWHLDGMLYDRDERMQRVEVRGTLPLVAWSELLHALAWPQQPILVHLIDHGRLVEAASMAALWRADDRT